MVSSAAGMGKVTAVICRRRPSRVTLETRQLPPADAIALHSNHMLNRGHAYTTIIGSKDLIS
jgi:hypothetical protein